MIFIALAVIAMLVTIAHAAGYQVPLWVAVLVLCLAHFMEAFVR